MTNGQLKFHLGLLVPKKESERCAFMRVGNEVRGWEEKAITFFDDSYLVVAEGRRGGGEEGRRGGGDEGTRAGEEERRRGGEKTEGETVRRC